LFLIAKHIRDPYTLYDTSISGLFLIFLNLFYIPGCEDEDGAGVQVSWSFRLLFNQNLLAENEGFSLRWGILEREIRWSKFGTAE
jgi:hypothetical protein